MTAGNASGINDGAVALIVGSRAAGERAGAQPQMIDGAVAGRDALLEEDFLADELVRNS